MYTDEKLHCPECRKSSYFFIEEVNWIWRTANLQCCECAIIFFNQPFDVLKETGRFTIFRFSKGNSKRRLGHVPCWTKKRFDCFSCGKQDEFRVISHNQISGLSDIQCPNCKKTAKNLDLSKLRYGGVIF